MKSPLRYIGGKFYIKDWIISFFDYSKECYVELFGGGGHILLAKPPHKVEIFNDNDNLLINFFKILRDREEELAKEIEKLPYSRTLFNEFKNSDWENLDDLEKAVRWYYLNRTSFSGRIGEGWSYAFIRNPAKALNNAIGLFKKVRDRIKNVIIECRDYREIIRGIKKEREKDIMIYADPPYMNVNYYKSKWTIEDHKEFAEIMNRLDCSIAISYYEAEEIKEWYPEGKWNYNYKNTIKYSIGLTRNNKKNKKPKALELLLTNYNTQEKL